MSAVQSSWVAAGVVFLAAAVWLIFTGSVEYAKGITMGGGIAIIVYNVVAR